MVVLVLFLIVVVLKGGLSATSTPGLVTIIGFIATLLGLLANLVSQTAVAAKVVDTHTKVEAVEEKLNGNAGGRPA
jgi:hypothetical protein